MKRLTNAEKAELHKKLEEAEKAKFKPYENKIADLEKENAELKGLVNQYKASKCGSISLVNRNMIMFDQLTKAKEYIKLLLMNCVGVYESTGKTIAEIQAEAEQFISEVENV